MSKFHINSKGDAAPCKATKRACRFGEKDHFTSITDAVQEAERRLSDQSGGNIKSHKRETSEKEDSNKISRVKNIDNLVNSKSRLEDFGRSVRFYNNSTIEDVEITARNAAYKLRDSSEWSSSIKVKTKDSNQTVSFAYNRSEDIFEVKETDNIEFRTNKIFSSKRPEDAMLYIADHYRYND